MGRFSLRFAALGYLALILVGPLVMMVWRTAEDLGGAWGAISDPDTLSAFKLTLMVTVIAVVVNTIFGVVCALLIVRGNVPGQGFLNAFVDLPLSLSPVIVGFSLVTLYGLNGWFGWFQRNGHEILFAIALDRPRDDLRDLPFVVREVVPTLREIGTEQEQAAQTLGACGWQTFWRITLPSIRWAVIYGVMLTAARGIGEFGAVAVVSGNFAGADADGDAAGRGRISVRVRELRSRVRHLVRARCERRHHSSRHDLYPTEGSCLMSIQARNISKRFGGFIALDDVSLEVESGSLTALLGPSGSGKSTLLRVIAGLEVPDAGEIVISGEYATTLKPQKRNVGFVFQHYAAFKHMTVRDNIAFGLKVRKRPKAEIRERVDELLKLVQLEAFGHRYPAHLSGGQRQRMALARALAPEPEVLLLDEPFGALDARVRAELRDWLRRLHEEVHVTTIFVTHDQAEAMDVASQIAVMNQRASSRWGARPSSTTSLRRNS